MHEVDIGKRVIFNFTPQLWQKRYTENDAMIWRGYAPLTDTGMNKIKKAEIELNAKFKGEILLRGITVSSANLTPGSTILITLLWQLPSRLPTTNLAVFMHFKHNGKTIFQGDHNFAPHTIGRRSNGTEFTAVEQQQLTIPQNIPAGKYTIEMGLYQRQSPHTRLSVSSPRKTKKDSIVIPLQ